MPTSERELDRARRVSVALGEDGSVEWTNGTAHWRMRRDGPEAVRAVDLVLAALGACVAGTIRSYAESHGIDGLSGVRVEVLGSEVRSPSRLASAALEVTLEGAVAPEDAMRLRRAGQHCKIHASLARGVEVRFS